MSEPTLDELRSEVNHAREQLIGTTHLLVERLDVKSRAARKVAALRAFVAANPQPVAAGGGGVLLLVVVRRRRRKGRRSSS